jgi:hypothetical protein
VLFVPVSMYLISSSLMRLSVLRRRLSVFVCYVALEFVCYRVVVFVVFAAFVLADVRLSVEVFALFCIVVCISMVYMISHAISSVLRMCNVIVFVVSSLDLRLFVCIIEGLVAREFRGQGSDL